MTYLRFLVADFAVWFCGCPTLYWAAPLKWEEYIEAGLDQSLEEELI